MYVDDTWLIVIAAVLVALAFSSLILSLTVGRARKARKEAERDLLMAEGYMKVSNESLNKQTLKERTMDVSVETKNGTSTLIIGLFNDQDLAKFSSLVPLIKEGTNIEVLGNFFVPAHSVKYLAPDTWAIKDTTNDTPWEVTDNNGLMHHFDIRTTSI